MLSFYKKLFLYEMSHSIFDIYIYKTKLTITHFWYILCECILCVKAL